MNTAVLWYFEGVDLFRMLCPNKVKNLSKTHRLISFKRDQFIFRPEDSSNHIYMVAKGRVKIGHHGEDGNEVVSATLSKGDVFGELPLKDGMQGQDFAQAMDGVVICPITIDELKALMYDNKDLSFKILKLFGLRVTKLERKVELLVFKDARTRIIEFLSDVPAWKGVMNGTDATIPTRLTYKDIASLTGTSRQIVTTVLNDLKEKNLITFNRKQVVITDIDKLQ